MIFSPKMANKILAGRKTETRRRIKEGETHCRYRVGRDYAVQPGRGKPSKGRITIVAVERQKLGELTYESARHEGFKTRDDFADYWRELYGDYDVEQEVWAIRFALFADAPLYLSATGFPAYTRDRHMALDAHRPDPDEPAEVVPPGEVADLGLSRMNRERFEQEHKREIMRREVRSCAALLEQTASEQLKAGRDVRPMLDRVRNEIEKSKQRAQAA